VTRFRALAPTLDPNVDEDIRTLMADIDASLEDLDRRIEAERPPERKSVLETARRTGPELPVVAAEAMPTTAAEASSFLAELEREATSRRWRPRPRRGACMRRSVASFTFSICFVVTATR
jgi:hypothetical protein